MITAPRMPLGHPARQAECESALRSEVFALHERTSMPTGPELMALWNEARKAGWTGMEIATAMRTLEDKFKAARNSATNN
jgi:hypothetical protein